MNKKAVLLLAFVVASAGLCIADELASVSEVVEASADAKAMADKEKVEEATEEVAE